MRRPDDSGVRNAHVGAEQGGGNQEIFKLTKLRCTLPSSGGNVSKGTDHVGFTGTKSGALFSVAFFV